MKPLVLGNGLLGSEITGIPILLPIGVAGGFGLAVYEQHHPDPFIKKMDKKKSVKK